MYYHISTTFTECLLAPVADIVFIVDQSSTTGIEQFRLVHNLLFNTVAGLNIGSNKVRVGVVLYSTRPKAEMYLNTYGSKQDVLNHIRRLPYIKSETTKTGEALTFVRTDVFSSRRGSRKEIGVPQLAVVITTGNSTDDVSQPARQLRESGVRIFTVGVNDYNRTGLQQIASHPPLTFVFTVEDLVNLATIQKDLRTSICHEANQRRYPVWKGIPPVLGFLRRLRIPLLRSSRPESPFRSPETPLFRSNILKQGRHDWQKWPNKENGRTIQQALKFLWFTKN